MDSFGIGAGIKGAALTYLEAARGTGRTEALISSLKEGDRVVFISSQEASRVRERCAAIGVHIKVEVMDPRRPDDLRSLRRISGRTILDHSYVEEYYRLCIIQAEDHLIFLQKNMNQGYEHPDSTLAEKEVARWS